MIRTVAVAGYRTLRDVTLTLGGLTLVTGANGSGKSNLYRALRLLADCGSGRVIGALAEEGGLSSTLWAGPELGSRRSDGPAEGTRRSAPVSLRLGVATDDHGYAIDLGLPPADLGTTAFARDPEIKREVVWAGGVLRPGTLQADRRNGHVRLRDDQGRWRDLERRLRPHDSLVGEVVDPVGAPDVLDIRDRLRAWRFYDQLRTDQVAPARRPRVGTRTPVLSDDGGDLAAAIQTIRESGAGDVLDAAVDDAFPGSRVEVLVSDGLFTVALRQPGVLRPLTGAELSDGTLRYLLLAAALLTTRPPELLVLNEPETSLHPELLPALARLVVAAARTTQVVVVTHSAALLDAVTGAGPASRDHDVVRVHLRKELGETIVDGREGVLDVPLWAWPSR